MTMKQKDTSALQKSVKKSLKRQDSGQMQLQQLAQRVADQHADDVYWTAPTVQELILQSTHKFHVDDNSQMVTLLPKKDKKDKKNKKRSNNTDCENNEMAKKKSRSEPTPTTLEAVHNWRRDNKIVVLEAQPTTTSSSSSASNNEKFFPWTSFAQVSSLSVPEASSNLHPALLDHCVTGNGFDKPSPIQAQAWPILVQQKDVVGIAETGASRFVVDWIACAS
jgi:hypothetical protein